MPVSSMARDTETDEHLTFCDAVSTELGSRLGM